MRSQMRAWAHVDAHDDDDDDGRRLSHRDGRDDERPVRCFAFVACGGTEERREDVCLDDDDERARIFFFFFLFYSNDDDDDDDDERATPVSRDWRRERIPGNARW